jgi:exodeoxyribonuclease VII small subunit
MSKTTKKAAPSFEEAMQQLDQYVRQLEGGELTLQDALKHFEEGTKLARYCEEKLGEAKGKVEVLLKNANGDPETAPLNMES